MYMPTLTCTHARWLGLTTGYSVVSMAYRSTALALCTLGTCSPKGNFICQELTRLAPSLPHRSIPSKYTLRCERRFIARYRDSEILRDTRQGLLRKDASDASYLRAPHPLSCVQI